MEPQTDQQGEIFPGIDVNPESWKYTAIRQFPRIKRPSDRFSRGTPVICDAFGIWAEGLIAEVMPSRNNKPPALRICLKFGISSLCRRVLEECVREECDDSLCEDGYLAMADWGGVFAREDLEKTIIRSRSLAISIPGYGVEAYKQATRLLKMIEDMEARQKIC